MAISYSRALSQPRDRTQLSCISCIGRQILYHLSHLGRSTECWYLAEKVLHLIMFSRMFWLFLVLCHFHIHFWMSMYIFTTGFWLGLLSVCSVPHTHSLLPLHLFFSDVIFLNLSWWYFTVFYVVVFVRFIPWHLIWFGGIVNSIFKATFSSYSCNIKTGLVFVLLQRLYCSCILIL